MIKSLSRMFGFAALAVCVALSSGRAFASNTFAAGAAQISVPCHFEFDARSSGGHVTEQCDFTTGRELYVGRVVCFAAAGNVATFVWQMEIAPQGKEGWYQQVFVVDNGAPGHRVPDAFLNYPEGPSSPCPYITPTSAGTNPILKGNFVVSTDE